MVKAKKEIQEISVTVETLSKEEAIALQLICAYISKGAGVSQAVKEARRDYLEVRTSLSSIIHGS